ncbi:putative inositol monophosphatase 3 isoform X1 [Polistes fuscatus]|uniref:putative inositol monophosphatase 3 isoform X1 n=2 Tax=Polistes fuscatus TaxID=30207 RepID=UPI001CAA2ECA|nr:putative inositol monophosphatase 3 isoform X1 [Polistes fuscatus]XP_043493770.1 putative inositol monophosphatase 3 isoform X1 [Polistes fuscatus]
MLRMNVRTRRFSLCAILLLLGALYFFSRKSFILDSNSKNIVSLRLLLNAAIKAAELGGYEVVYVHDQTTFNVESKGKTKEGVNNPVTAADYRSHCVMYHSLKDAFSGITVISEEASKDCDKVFVPDPWVPVSNLKEYDIGDDFENIEDITIWIDPLDATKEFTENLLQYVTTMVCIAVRGKPVIGVIYKPFETKKEHKLYWAWVGRGASPNLYNLPKHGGNEPPILIVSRSHAGQVHNISKIAFGDFQIVSAAGAGFKFLEVAVGNATAYIHTTAINKWDICSGTAIISALGGKTTSLFDGHFINFDSSDTKILTSGLLATMTGHNWYLDKFLNI